MSLQSAPTTASTWIELADKRTPAADDDQSGMKVASARVSPRRPAIRGLSAFELLDDEVARAFLDDRLDIEVFVS